MKSGEARWDFFTNHAHVIFYLQAYPDRPLRQVALAIGITERAVQRIVAELEAEGYLKRTKVGRQNQYQIEGDVALCHPRQAHRTLQELLDWDASDAVADSLDDYKALENWKVGEHGSEI
ncbi:helix-turn-helix domain-containing protein [Coraliomargarita algicola]|uniref:Helix-turn-helix domain-containing protein n=1 Tax=Coraliomargarita algicola TaxID=3092156 RepID=A0ABZ0RLX2_9BACT|nr:helix-turn-helix domain-containing protein [Coraliomargarita sp. J2-16]WPJ97211.1 helix-turn-helix domain-containing protein [Coraliomargarita sp. J2-16]